MAASVGQLMIGIGLDFSALDAGMVAADQTVKNAVSQISKDGVITLSTDFDARKLDAAGATLDQIKTKEAALTDELKKQEDVLKAWGNATNGQKIGVGVDAANVSETLNKAVSDINEQGKSVGIKVSIDLSPLEGAKKKVKDLGVTAKTAKETLATLGKDGKTAGDDMAAGAEKSERSFAALALKITAAGAALATLALAVKRLKENDWNFEKAFDVNAGLDKAKAAFESFKTSAKSGTDKAVVSLKSFFETLRGEGGVLDKTASKTEILKRALAGLAKANAAAGVVSSLLGVIKTGNPTIDGATAKLKKYIDTVRSLPFVSGKKDAMSRLGEAAKQSAAAFNSAAATMKGFQGKISAVGSGVSVLNAKILAVIAAVAALRRAMNFIGQGISDAAKIYDMAEQFNVAEKDMGEMLRTFQMAGVEAEAATKYMTRLFGQVIKGSGESLETLEKFGVALKDDKGNLVSYGEGLKRLAEGYKRAQKAGQIEEFMAGLGPRAAGLSDFFNKYAIYYENAVNRINRADIDPKRAADLDDEIKVLDSQIREVGLQFVSAFMPAAEESIPKLTDAFSELVEVIKENKEPLTDIARIIAAFAETAVETLGKAINLAGQLTNSDIAKAFRLDLGTIRKDVEGAAYFANKSMLGIFDPRAIIESGVLGIAALPGKFVIDKIYGDELAANRENLDKIAAAREDARNKEGTAEDRALERSERRMMAAIENVSRAREKAVKEYEKQLETLREPLETSIFKATHTDIENSLFDIESQAKKTRDKLEAAAKAAGKPIDEATLDLIDENAEKQKAKAIEDFTRGTVDVIDAIFQTGLQKRLADIEKEKRAWIQKGVDEVRATQAAERQKQQAVQDAAQSMFTSQRKYLEAFRAARQQEETGIEVFRGVKSSGGGGVVGALQEILRQDMGIKPGDRTSVEEINEFTAALEQAKRTLIPIGNAPQGPEIMRGLESAPAWAGHFESAINNAFAPLANGEIRLGADGIESRLDRTNEELRAIRESQTGPQDAPPPITITVQIDTAVTQDSAAMRQLADTVADQITPAVEAAIGQSWNSYAR